MRKIITATALLAATFLASISFAPRAVAGPFADDLSKCLANNANKDDQVVLVQWMFAMLSLNPSVKSLAVVTDDQRSEYNKKAAEMIQRLLLVDCHTEAVAALKNEGASALQTSFEIVGQVAARGLMSDPKVDAGMGGLVNYTDQAKWAQLYKDAGLPTANAPTATP